MSDVWVIEHGSEPRPARVLAAFREQIIRVEFTDSRGGERTCMARSVFPTRAEAVRAEKELEAKEKA